MRNRDKALAAVFLIVFAGFMIFSLLKHTGQQAEPTSKTVIEIHITGSTAPAAELKPVETPAILAEPVEASSAQAFMTPPEEVMASELATVTGQIEASECASSEETCTLPEEPEIDESGSIDTEAAEFTEDTTTDGCMSYLGTFTVTAYCNCPECCGSYSGGPTASGAYPAEGWTSACNAFPLGTIVYIDGIGTRCIEDRGDSIMDDTWIDLYFDDHDEAQSFGIRYLDVYVEAP